MVIDNVVSKLNWIRPVVKAIILIHIKVINVFDVWKFVIVEVGLFKVDEFVEFDEKLQVFSKWLDGWKI